MLIQEAKPESGPKELRVKIGVEYHLKLHALKLLRGKRMSEAVEEALAYYFEKVRFQQETELVEVPEATPDEPVAGPYPTRIVPVVEATDEP